MSVLRRLRTVLDTEGIPGLADRARHRVRITRADNLVLRRDTPPGGPQVRWAGADPALARALEIAGRFLRTLEIGRVTPDDRCVLEELAGLDQWKIPADRSARMLQEGWLGYVAKLNGRIVATSWAFTGTRWYNYDVGRTLVLAPGEAYHSRVFCHPDYRGRGVLPWLSELIVAEVTAEFGATCHFGVVDPVNWAMHRSLVAMGWSVTGHVGYFEGWGRRLHYILGRQSFPAMKPRFLVEPRPD